ncbi:hypothetical protein KP509_33G007300 [Ceratopteris richardii]|uniref:GATA-type domain-containing protein n=1 Tax=Ceratopteris richardii TaxID=49495 RepID=A0A8T2QN62_CERRI|nr:hypothetical protein KP509_33G007300 [Ceratopteris richardii]
MLHSPPLSKVYGHAHIKKFWLMQNQMETENRALLTSSSPSRSTSSSSGLGHDSKQSSQVSVACANTINLSSPSGLLTRPLGSNPACFSMAMTKQSSLVTCAESFNRSMYTYQSHGAVRASTSVLSDNRKLKDFYAVVSGAPAKSNPTEHARLFSSCREDDRSRNPPEWYSSRTSCEVLGDVHSPHVSDSDIDTGHGNSVTVEDSWRGAMFGEEGQQYDNTFKEFDCEKQSSRPSKCNQIFFSDLELPDSFSVPFQLPTNFFSDSEAKPCHRELNVSGSLYSVNTKAASIVNDRARKEDSEAFTKTEDGVSSSLRTCSICGTSKTPLWRSGPEGPKSLCNACGIRFKKARRVSVEDVDSLSPLSRPSRKPSNKMFKRKQEDMLRTDVKDLPQAKLDTAFCKFNASSTGCATQLLKRKRCSQPMNGQFAVRKYETTGSSTESSFSGNLHSPSVISSSSVSYFESSSKNDTLPLNVMDVGEDEQAAAMLLVYLSRGPVLT